MGWQSRAGGGSGAEPDPEPVSPGAPEAARSPDAPTPVNPVTANRDTSNRGTSAPGRDPRLSGFGRDGEWDACPPSAALAVALEAASGLEQRCPGGSRDELLGLLRQWQSLESWAAAAKLGVLRALVRDDDQPPPDGGYRGDLPVGWTRSLTHEVALALSMPAVSAEKLMWLAWDLQAALPGTGDLLARGELTLAKARAVDSALSLLGGEDVAKAEAMILPHLPGKTYSQVQKLAVQAAITVDPESAARRREDAEQNKSRVTMFREESGAAGLSGRDLPTDQTLAAMASVCARAREYQDSGVFPDDTRMDQFRVTAYLDLLNVITAETRIAMGQLVTVDRPAGEERDPDSGGPDNDRPDNDEPVDQEPVNAEPDDEEPQDEGPQDGEPPPDNGGASPDKGPGSPGGGCAEAQIAPRLADLVLPLATLLGLAERPGEGHGLGPLDPGLCRELGLAAIGSPWTQLCVTVTDPDGIAIGHGCARPARNRQHGNRGAVPALALPARVNLTIPAVRLPELAAASREGPPGRPSWSFTRGDDPGPPGGFGAWILALPDGRNLVVKLEPVPVFDCDHRHESHAYQPNDSLRHLVQVRDYECTFPPCARHARESDFEHAVPYDKGGATCACNAGARSRTCHQVKQSPGWSVTQPRPGWHEWQTPSGRSYTQAPKRYPA
jgi:hypothetical protein